MSGSTIITLRYIGRRRWELVSPSGHVIARDIRPKDTYEALEWGRAFISSWNNWTLRLEIPDEYSDKVLS